MFVNFAVKHKIIEVLIKSNIKMLVMKWLNL